MSNEKKENSLEAIDAIKLNNAAIKALEVVKGIVAQPYKDTREGHAGKFLLKGTGMFLLPDYNGVSEFSDGVKQAAQEGKIVFRPNHGSTHHVRGVYCINPVLDFLEKWGQDGIKQFIAQQKKSDQNFITKCQIAMAFYSSGRESEIGFNHPSEKYFDYRKQSALNFREFLYNNPEFKALYRQEEIDSYAKALIAGTYWKDENLVDDSVALNLTKIMGISHRLDLIRCFGPTQMETEADSIRELVCNGPDSKHDEASPSAETDLTQLFRYAQECILQSMPLHNYQFPPVDIMP